MSRGGDRRFRRQGRRGSLALLVVRLGPTTSTRVRVCEISLHVSYALKATVKSQKAYCGRPHLGPGILDLEHQYVALCAAVL